MHKTALKISTTIYALVLTGVIMAFSLTSCQQQAPTFKTKRVVILESNTITFVHIPMGLDSIYRNEDTVWVNLITHRIDDTDSNTMCGVIKP